MSDEKRPDDTGLTPSASQTVAALSLTRRGLDLAKALGSASDPPPPGPDRTTFYRGYREEAREYVEEARSLFFDQSDPQTFEQCAEAATRGAFLGLLAMAAHYEPAWTVAKLQDTRHWFEVSLRGDHREIHAIFTFASDMASSLTESPAQRLERDIRPVLGELQEALLTRNGGDHPISDDILDPLTVFLNEVYDAVYARSDSVAAPTKP